MGVSMDRMKLLSVVLVMFTVTLMSQSVEGRRFYVGGKDGWVIHPAEDYSHWAQRLRFLVNDTLYFNYKKGSDSVLQVSKDDYNTCNTAHPLATFNDGSSEFTLSRSGPFFFISGIKDHCDHGQKIIVVVLSERHFTPPASGGSGGSSPAPGGSSTSPAPGASSPGGGGSSTTPAPGASSPGGSSTSPGGGGSSTSPGGGGSSSSPAPGASSPGGSRGSSTSPAPAASSPGGSSHSSPAASPSTAGAGSPSGSGSPSASGPAGAAGSPSGVSPGGAAGSPGKPADVTSPPPSPSKSGAATLISKVSVPVALMVFTVLLV